MGISGTQFSRPENHCISAPTKTLKGNIFLTATTTHPELGTAQKGNLEKDKEL